MFGWHEQEKKTFIRIFKLLIPLLFGFASKLKYGTQTLFFAYYPLLLYASKCWKGIVFYE